MNALAHAPERCPTCGQPLPAMPRPRVSLDDNIFIAETGTARLTRTEAEVLFLLAARAPGVIGHDSLIGGVYGIAEPADPRAVIRVAIARIRRKIEPLGWTVAATYGEGYRLRPGRVRPRPPTPRERCAAITAALRDGFPTRMERGGSAHGSAPTAVSEAARRLGMDPRTLHAWLRVAESKRGYRLERS